MGEKIIEVNNLTKVFPNGVKALDDLSLTVSRGEIYGLIGANGAGKTTTIKILLGLMKPTSGEGLVFGTRLRENREELLQKVGYVSETSTLYENMTVEEILRLTRGFYKGWDNTLEKRYLDMFALRRKEKIKKLSKGMKTQLSLISALSFKPELLILDEPTSGLDPIWRQEFIQTIVGEIGQWGTTVLFSSHILSEVERIADTVGIMKSGKVILQREMDELKVNEKVIRVVFQKNIDDNHLWLDGVREVTRQGKGYVIKVADNFETVYMTISKIPHFTLEIVERNLEDIFMEYAKGEVRK